jgi:hypothetical protein
MRISLIADLDDGTREYATTVTYWDLSRNELGQFAAMLAVRLADELLIPHTDHDSAKAMTWESRPWHCVTSDSGCTHSSTSADDPVKPNGPHPT